MIGVFHSRDTMALFGHDARHVYVYTGSEWGSSPDSPHACCLYLSLTTKEIAWYVIQNVDLKSAIDCPAAGISPTNDFQKGTPADPDPIFRLDLSDNLYSHDDLSARLAESMDLPVLREPDVRVSMPRGYSALSIWHHGQINKWKSLFRKGDAAAWLPLWYGNKYPANAPDAIGLQNDARAFTCGRLLLDFLYDLKYSRVFGNCPGIDQIEYKLLSHPLVNAIHDKAQYYWVREDWLKVYSKNRDAKDGSAEDIALRVCESADEWLEACMESGAPLLFREASQWFDPIEDEMRRVVFDPGVDGEVSACGKVGPWRKIIDYQIRLQPLDIGTHANDRRVDLYRRVAGWFLARYDLNAAAATQVLHLMHVGRDVKDSGDNRKFRKLLGKGWSWLAPVFGSARDVFNKQIIPRMQRRVGVISQRLRVWLAAGGEKYPWLRIPESFQCISQCLAKVKAGASGNAKNVKTAVDKSRVFLSVRIRRLLYIGISAASYPLPYHPVTRVVAILLVFVVCAYVMGVCGLYDGVTHAWVKLLVVHVVNILPVFFLLLAIACFCVWARLKGRFVRHLRNALLVVRLGLPRLFFAISGAWMMFYSEGFWSLNVMVGPHDVLFVGIPVLMISLVFTMVKTYNMTGDAVRAVGRSFLMSGMALLISFGVGVVLMSNFAGAAIEETINANDPGTKAMAYADYVENAKTAFGTNCLPANLPGADIAAPYPHLIEQTRVLGRLRAAYILESEYDGCGAWAAFWRHLASVRIFPAMLLYYSCYAVFFGLFLQLIFGDKEMTESL